MRLRHLHLRGTTPYAAASALQDLLVRAKISYEHPGAGSSPSALALTRSPLLVTFMSAPTYTTGRRGTTLSASQLETLTRGTAHGAADAVYTPTARGGQITFHGPGQLTAYPIVHLPSQGLGVRTYVELLERACVATLARHRVVGFTRPEHPGVWVGGNQKLVSVGVHVRRGVTCFGAGINVCTDPMWWRRITACGIDGVEMVGLTDVGGLVQGRDTDERVGAVGQSFALALADRLGVDGVLDVRVEDGDRLMQLALERGVEGS